MRILRILTGIRGRLYDRDFTASARLPVRDVHPENHLKRLSALSQYFFTALTCSLITFTTAYRSCPLNKAFILTSRIPGFERCEIILNLYSLFNKPWIGFYVPIKNLQRFISWIRLLTFWVGSMHSNYPNSKHWLTVYLSTCMIISKGAQLTSPLLMSSRSCTPNRRMRFCSTRSGYMQTTD